MVTKKELMEHIRWTVNYYTGERYLNMVRSNRYHPSMVKEAEAEMIMTLQIMWGLIREPNHPLNGAEVPSTPWIDGIYYDITHNSSL